MQIGDSTLLNDDFWAIIALISAGESEDSIIVQQCKHYILRYQQSDGGWAYDTAATWGTDVDSTGAAIMALIIAGEDASSEAITSGLDYIKNNQGTDGGFQSWGASNADTDSSGIWAITACGQDPTSDVWTKDGNNPIDHLLGLQTDTGVFEYTPGVGGAWPARTTAQAIIALTGNYYPVKITDVVTLEDRVGTLEDTIATLGSDLSTLEDTIATIESALSSLEDTIATLGSDLSALEDTSATTKSDLDSLEDKAATTKSNLDSLEDRVDTIVIVSWIALGGAGVAIILGLAGLVRKK